MAWDEDLSPEQRAAASSGQRHHVLLAGPGTGKTFVLVRRIEYLIEAEGVSPNEITALAFTRAAAAEMRERLEEKLGAKGRRVRTSTLHSYALRELLAKGAQQLPAPVRVAGDWEERWIVMEELARLLNRPVNQIRNQRGTGALNRLADDWDTLTVDGHGWEAGHPDPGFLAAWRRHREVYGYTLRSELVYQLLVELRTNAGFEVPHAAALIVDEYQDLNHCELDTVRFLAERCGAFVYGAGDDDQSIYRFRNAVPAGIRTFAESYAGAARLVLTECRRCGPQVVELANWIIQQEQEREQKGLRSITPWPATVHLLRFQHQTAEAAAVARAIQAEIEAGTPAEEILVLVKSDPHNRIADAIRGAFGESGIRLYQPRGNAIGDELSRVLQYLTLAQRAAAGIDDLAMRALLQLEDNGIGADRLWAVTQLALDRPCRFSDAIAFIEAHPEDFTSRLGDIVTERDRILSLAQELTPNDDETMPAWIARAGGALAVDEESLCVLEAAAQRIEAELEDAAVDASGDESQPATAAPHRDFVAELFSAMTSLGESLPARMPDHVTFTTMHGAKGLSADIVFALQIEDEILPGETAGPDLDEARRLFYVSVTRARRKLVIGACRRRTGPQRFVGSQQTERRTVSTFVRDYGLTEESLAQYLDAIEPRGMDA